MNALDVRWRETMFTMPIGLGLKYRLGELWALRLELADNLMFGTNSIGFQNNPSILGGLEFHFGSSRSRRTYWPWDPSAKYW